MEPKIFYAVVDTEADGKRVVAPVAGVLQEDGTAKILLDSAYVPPAPGGITIGKAIAMAMVFGG